MAKYLNPKSDLVFKRIFGQEKDLLISFLNAILPLEEENHIIDLDYLPSEEVPEIPEFKYSIVDVKCRANNNSFFIVEMQVNWTDAFMQRVLFNAGKAYIRQLYKGESYNLLLPVFAVSIIDYVFDRDTTEYYHHYKIVNVNNSKEVIRGLQFVFIELPKFNASTYTQKKMQALWLRFLKETGTEAPLSEDFMKEKEIAKAVKLAEIGAYSEAQLEYYDKYFDAVSTERTFVVEAEERGEKKGIKIALEMALEKLIAAGIPIDDAKKILGLD